MTRLASRRSLPLLISLALNVLLLSAIGGHFLREAADDEPKRRTSFVERMAERLSADDAARLRAVYEQHGDALAALRNTVELRQEDYRRALRSEPYDPAAVERALDRLVAERSEMYRAFGRIIAEAATGMSLEGRAVLAERRRRR